MHLCNKETNNSVASLLELLQHTYLQLLPLLEHVWIRMITRRLSRIPILYAGNYILLLVTKNNIQIILLYSILASRPPVIILVE